MERFRISETDEGKLDIRGYLLNPRERDELIEEIRLQLITPEERKKLLREVEADFFKFEVSQLHFEDGFSQQEIADKMGFSVHTIYRCFKKEGWTPRNSTKKIDLDHKEVRRLYNDEGLTQQDVADRLGVSKSSIYRHFRKNNMKPLRIATREEVDSKEVHRLHFEERLNREEVAEKLGVSEQTISRIFRDKEWVNNRVTRSRLDIDEVHRLYFDEKLTQKEVAKKIGVSTQTVSRIFKDQNWEARRTKADIDEIYRLYFIENLTQREVAKKLDVRGETISLHFRKQNWKPRSRKIDDSKSKYLEVNIDELHRLYFDEKFNRSEVAKIMDISPAIVSRIFKEKNWKYRDYLVHATEGERKQAKVENRKKTQFKVVEMRKKLFGKKCQICTEERKIAIHRKDGAEHNPDDLWKIKYLRTVTPDEYTAVCIPCHRGVHWMMSEYSQNWKQIKTQATKNIQSEVKIKRPLEIPNETVSSSETYLKLKTDFEGSEEELRRAMFGEKCYFCGLHYNEGKRLIIHRKDGRPHSDKLTTQVRYFRTLNPKEWIPLCQKHHRHTHWAMNNLDLEWTDLEKGKLKESGAEGEI